MAPVVPNPCQTKSEITSALANEAVEPTDRSKPPTDSEIETPMAITVTMAIERRILMMLLASRKLSDTAEQGDQRRHGQQHAPFVEEIEQLLAPWQRRPQG